jgi:hypothetical protein
MPTYEIRYKYARKIKANNEEEAVERFWEIYRDTADQEVSIKLLEE